ncbi:HFL055Cp [Eremothecium sinecaudum]|uniref:Stationary phase protein 4 n=1 Tax=Eremothecium sinecaudum TaxID=45286 RepID=A0A0X8HUL4_9SACH|nr:HFL055Cp [Eremothecium sinecaudum]AMD21801.1 HFL055Cp [Eremothecium sinecaudum]
MLGGFFGQFTVYNRNKHSRPGLSGANHSNIGAGKTTFIFADEYREPVRRASTTSESELTASSSASENITAHDSLPAAGLPKRAATEMNPNMVDISTLSQGEFERLKATLRKGSPNNRVNF